jgi:hypothetical protein
MKELTAHFKFYIKLEAEVIEDVEDEVFEWWTSRLPTTEEIPSYVVIEKEIG